MKRTIALIALIAIFTGCLGLAESTQEREWTSSNGKTLTAIALSVEGGKVRLKKKNGKELQVPIQKLIKENREFLNKHFSNKLEGEASGAAEGFPYPLGETTEEISCKGGFSYYLHLPKSLQKGKKYAVLFVMNPAGGDRWTCDRYLAGAERNSWIIAVSKQSKNHYGKSWDAVLEMMDHVKKTLPIDPKRIYISGMSGGSRVAFVISQQRKEIAGIIACGAGGQIGRSKQIVYGLCGSNCFNRNGMAASFRKFRHKGSRLRYFVGRHDWADSELCDDAMTHLNGMFLSQNRDKYRNDFKDYSNRLDELIEGNKNDHKFRAYMWADFAKNHKISLVQSRGTYELLRKDPLCELYIKGLKGVQKFAMKELGYTKASVRDVNPKVEAKCKREAKKYIGTPWAEVLNKMAGGAK